jgi:hypothetical protein
MTHLTGLSDPLKTCLVSLLCKNPKNRLKASDFLVHYNPIYFSYVGFFLSYDVSVES